MTAAAPTVLPTHVAGTLEVRPESAGVAESLPDLPSPADRAFSARNALQNPLTPASDKERVLSRFRLESAILPDIPGVSLLESSPLAGAARHIGAQHFNTQDGSSANAFAICYRLSKRSSVQVIPGDPAPVKIPVTTMANNMGVTVGMVLRLSKTN